MMQDLIYFSPFEPERMHEYGAVEKCHFDHKPTLVEIVHTIKYNDYTIKWISYTDHLLHSNRNMYMRRGKYINSYADYHGDTIVLLKDNETGDTYAVEYQYVMFLTGEVLE